MRTHTHTYTPPPFLHTRRGIYKTFTLFLSQWWYHYRTARHVIPACTCPDYLYDGRRSLPRREKYTLDAGKLAAYTLVSFGRVSCSQDTRARVCVCTCVCVCVFARVMHISGWPVRCLPSLPLKRRRSSAKFPTRTPTSIIFHRCLPSSTAINARFIRSRLLEHLPRIRLLFNSR